MARSGPDWGSAAPQATVEILLDLAELAARLRSPSRFDRRGKVFWSDTCAEGNEAWNAVIVGAEGDAGYDTAQATMFDGMSMHLYAGPNEDNYTSYFQTHAYPGLSAMGWEMAFWFQSECKAYEWTLAIATGDTLYAPEIKYDTILGGFYYRDSGSSWQLIESGTFFLDDVDDFGYMWNNVKLVVDPTTGYYKRLIVNRWEYDLSSYAMPGAASAAAPFIDHVFTIRCGSAGTCETNVGYHVLTCDEP